MSRLTLEDAENAMDFERTLAGAVDARVRKSKRLIYSSPERVFRVIFTDDNSKTSSAFDYLLDAVNAYNDIKI
jgi:hypothetical protein